MTHHRADPSQLAEVPISAYAWVISYSPRSDYAIRRLLSFPHEFGHDVATACAAIRDCLIGTLLLRRTVEFQYLCSDTLKQVGSAAISLIWYLHCAAR